LIGLSTIAVGCTLSNNIIYGIKQYQELSVLADKYLSLYPNLDSVQRKIYYELIKWIVVIGGSVIAGGYCTIAFQGSFAMQLVKKLTDKAHKALPLEIDLPTTNTTILLNESIVNNFEAKNQLFDFNAKKNLLISSIPNRKNIQEEVPVNTENKEVTAASKDVTKKDTPQILT
jgi:hypothetical protein